MSEQHVDPSGNTEAFRAFTRTEPESRTSSGRLPLLIGGAAGLALVIALIAWLAT